MTTSLGADVQARHLATALAVGEEKSVVRALAIDVVYRAAAGGTRNLGKAQTMARDIELKARRIGDAKLIAITKLAVGGTRFFGGDYRRTAFAFEEAEQMLATMVGVEWERTTARFFRCYSRIAMGDFRGTRRATSRRRWSTPSGATISTRAACSAPRPACGAASSATTPTARCAASSTAAARAGRTSRSS